MRAAWAVVFLVSACASPKSVDVPAASLPAAPASASASASAAPAVPRSSGLAFESINERGRIDLGGHVAIVDFWATWCGPCKRAFPKLQAIWDRHAGEGLIVIGLAMDDDGDAPLEFVHTRGTTFPIALDAGHAQYGRWHLTMMPSTVVLDRNGEIHHRYDGYHEGEDAELEQDVVSLLASK
jgi:thiol-disulfide isomerase/thioredoxin